jgi:hypothetical protein
LLRSVQRFHLDFACAAWTPIQHQGNRILPMQQQHFESYPCSTYKASCLCCRRRFTFSVFSSFILVYLNLHHAAQKESHFYKIYFICFLVLHDHRSTVANSYLIFLTSYKLKESSTKFITNIFWILNPYFSEVNHEVYLI